MCRELKKWLAILGGAVAIFCSFTYSLCAGGGLVQRLYGLNATVSPGKQLDPIKEKITK